MDGQTAAMERLNRTVDYERPEAPEGRAAPEVPVGLEWVDGGIDKLHALLSQLEDALAMILPAEGEGRAVASDSARANRTALGQALGGFGARIDAANHRLSELTDRVRVAL